VNSVEFTDRETMLGKMNPSKKPGKLMQTLPAFKPNKPKGNKGKKYKEAMKKVMENRGAVLYEPKPMPKPPSGGKPKGPYKKPGKPGKPVKIPADKGRPVSGRPVSGIPGMNYRSGIGKGQKARVLAKLKKMRENA